MDTSWLMNEGKLHTYMCQHSIGQNRIARLTRRQGTQIGGWNGENGAWLAAQPGRHPQSAGNMALCCREIAAIKLPNLHLAWFSTGTFCLNVWKLFSSSMHRKVLHLTLAWWSLALSPLSSAFGTSLRLMPCLFHGWI
ncbi:hypothetical protein [Janthinobacterium sp. JC611]|uniref:hypothetical protein n=1 Tax=Janthinobacterium sp. JC611 TaxID=2816201 RepID=UPI001BFD6AA3|nr:hypothetical protein [Janthinobacterium sp. JC611]